MKTRVVQTEEPHLEQWRLLSRYSYERNIARFLTSRLGSSPTPDVPEYVAGCMRQASAYFQAAASAPLDIQPLLLYYGVTNLLAGAGAMLTGQKLPITTHGMALQQPASSGNRIADLEIVPSAAGGSGLFLFARTFADGVALPAGVPWTVGEILGSIPDLKERFLECFPGEMTYTLAVEVLRREGLVVERVALNEFTAGVAPLDWLRRVPGLTDAYIRPALGPNYVVLRRKVGADEIGSRSLGGNKWLHIAHEKRRLMVEPGQLVLMLMGLYALGHISRYFPEQWNPFVRADETGERVLVERFLEIVLRFIPNLVLNAILGEQVQFVYPVSTGAGADAPLSEEEIKSVVRQEIDDALKDKTV